MTRSAGREGTGPAVPPPLPPNEDLRVAALRAYDILDTAEEEIYNAITQAAADACAAPMASLTFVDSTRQWFKSKIGLTDRETSRDISFCAHAINGNTLFVVEDAQTDERVKSYSNVTGSPGLRFYAGMPLITSGGLALGTLCVLDTVPRKLTELQSQTLRALADSAMRVLNLRRNSGVALFAKAVDMTSDGVTISDLAPDGKLRILYANNSFLHFTGCSYHEVINQLCTFPISSHHSVEEACETALQRAQATTVEAKFHAPSHSCLWDRISFVPYVDEGGRLKYMVAVHRDITVAKEAETQLQQLHAMRTTLSTVDHVVRNFMNAAQLYSEHVTSGRAIEQPMQDLFHDALEKTRKHLTSLNQLSVFKDRPTPFGVSLLETNPCEDD